MAGSAEKGEIDMAELPDPISHYCHAVRFGDLLFISGMTGVDRSTPGDKDVVTQTRETFRRMQLVLEQVGASFADVLKVTVFLLDVEDRTKINPVRKEFFGDARPASTLIGVKALAMPDLRIEIEAVVGIPS